MSATRTESEGQAEGGNPLAPTPGPEPQSHLFIILLLVGLIGGGAGGYLGNRFHGLIPRPEMSAKYYKESEERWATLNFSPDVVEEMKQKSAIQMARNAALVLGIVGALLGGLFALGTGMGRKNPKAGVWGALVGTIAGGGFGVLAGYVGVGLAVMLDRYQVQVVQPGDLAAAWLRSMYLTVAVHTAQWCLVACAISLAVGIACRSSWKQTGRILAFVCAAGFLAAVAYTPLASGLFPDLKSELPFPEGAWNRLLFVMLAALAMAVAIAVAVRPKDIAPPMARESTHGEGT